jgi:hypothetical protein
MAILAQQVRWYAEIFARPGMLQEPVVMLGFQEIGIPSLCFSRAGARPLQQIHARVARRMRSLPEITNQEFEAPNLVDLLARRGLRDIRVIDPHDPRSDVKYDMNQPVPRTAWESCQTFIDIGCLEHVFDTRTCLENVLRMVRVGGFYMLHTCVNGYLGHGLHTFNHEGLIDALELNGFRIDYLRFMTSEGDLVTTPGEAQDTLILMLAQKERALEEFHCPQQRGWKEAYSRINRAMPRRENIERLKGWVSWVLPPIALDAYRLLRGDRRRALVAPGIGGDRQRNG